MRVFCMHIPRTYINEAHATYETQWLLTPARIFKEVLNELQESVDGKFSLEFYCVENIIYLCLTGDTEILDLLINTLFALFDSYEFHEIEDYTKQISFDTVVASAELRYLRTDVLPCLDYTAFAFNSVVPISAPLTKLPANDRALIQIVCSPVKNGFFLHFDLFIKRMWVRLLFVTNPKNWFKKGIENKFNDKMIEKCAGKLYKVNYRIAALTELPPNTSKDIREATVSRLKNHVKVIGNTLSFLSTLTQNAYRIGKIEEGYDKFKKFQERALINPIRLGTIELCTLWHPVRLMAIPNTAQVMARKGAPPKNLPIDFNDPQISFIAHTNFRRTVETFGMRRYDRRRHLYMVGKSGSGKSCLLQLLVKSDIDNGFGCCVLDPHGDLIDDILRMIPPHRVKDVVLFDPSDTKFPPSFNPLSAVRPELKMRATIAFVEVFRRVLGSDWSEKMDHVIRYAMLALLNIPNSSILSLRKLLTDDEYRETVLQRVDDEQVRRFWQEEFVARRKEFEEGTISRILNRLDHLLATEMVRNIIGQPMNLFNFREFMDTRKIVLMKVSKGILGGENASFLGSLIIGKVFEAAMSRADIPLESRQDFYFYIDEFQNFATESFGEILSESRKYRLCLTFANQYLGQLPEDIRLTIFGNVGNILSFRVGGNDAAAMATEFQPRFEGEDLMNLPDREFYLKMSIDGEMQEAFSGRTLDRYVPKDGDHVAHECIKHSRAQYSLPLEQATEALAASARAEEQP